MLHQALTFVTEHLVFLAILHAGLCTTPNALRRDVIGSGYLLRTLVVVIVLVPLLALLVTRLPMGPFERRVIVLMAMCPGAGLLPLMARLRGATEASATGLLIALTLVAPFTVTGWAICLSWFGGFQFQLSPLSLLAFVAPRVFIPLLLGWGLQGLWPRLAEVLGKATQVMTVVAFGLTLAGWLTVGGPILLRAHATAWLALVILVPISAWLGYQAGGPTEGGRRALASAAVMGNPGLALAVGSTLLASRSPSLAVMAAYILARSIVLFVYSRFTRTRTKSLRYRV